MKLEGDYLFEAPVEEVWKALMDPAVLAAVLPGCEKLELVDGRFVGELNVKVGPIQGKFQGKVDLKDIDEPKSYTMVVDGRGAPGFVKANASVKLEAEGEHTRLRYDADAQVGGKIASVGQRLIEVSSRAITKQSLEGLHENIKLRYAAVLAAEEEEDDATAAEPVAEPAKTAATTEAAATEEASKEEPAKEEPAKDQPPKEEPPKEVASKEEAPKEEAPAEEASSAEVAAPAQKKKKAPAPVALKQVDQKALAATIAKEAAKSLLPPPVLYGLVALVLALVVWLLMR